MGLHQNSILTS